MRHRSAAAFPVSGVAYVAERRACRVEIIRDDDAVQVIRRPRVIDDDAGLRGKQHRDCELIGEGHTDRGGGLADGVLLVNFLYGYKKVLAVWLEIGK